MRVVLILIFTFSFFSGTAASKSSDPFVTFVQFEGNTFFDHDELARRVPVGKGIFLSREFMRLFADEILGYYSSKGFHHVIAHPDYRVRDGVFTINIYENEERPKNPQKAFRTVQRMLARDDVELDLDRRKDAVLQVLLAYEENDRNKNDEIALQRENILRYNSLRLSEQRERVLQARLLMERIQDHKSMINLRMRNNAIRRLEQMKVIQSYLDSQKEVDVLLPYLDTQKEANFLP